MTKADQIDAALKQLAYDTATALLAMEAIDRFVNDAPAASKERLFDILKETDQ